MQQGNYEVQVIDVSGKIIYCQLMNFKAGKIDLELKIATVPGIYFLKVTNNQSQMVKKFVIE
ncbi:MAG: T9SS type A sorting domain-containing protein [Bacteroidia bacterium]|nr:T9SS type A sorting domain-containing protein [Bacteroidia bacterium]